MKGFAAPAVLLLAARSTLAAPPQERDVDTRYPYTGPKVPIADWVDQTINGNGKGFTRLVEPPAVRPNSAKPKNNINVVNLAYIPNGVNIHFQTPFGLTEKPTIHWGTSAKNLCYKTTGATITYVPWTQSRSFLTANLLTTFAAL